MFVLRMAVRETRASLQRLFFFFICIAVGVAAIVALRSVIQSVRGVFGAEAKSLIAADVVIATSRDWTADARATIDRRLADAGGAERTETIDTPTMVRPADRSKAVAKMAELRAVQPRFPLYGRVDLQGSQSYSPALLADHGVLVRPELLTAIDVKVGDQIVIGRSTFTIRGLIVREPGRGMGEFSLGPRVLIAYDDLASTGLLGFGSRARRAMLLKMPEERIEPLVKTLREDFKDDFINTRSFRSTEDQVGRDFDRAENYLSLVGLIIVILGGIAVSSVTRVFILQKIRSIAVLKCLGARSGQIISVYILQVMSLGLAGSLLGVAMARGVLAAIPLMLGASTSILAQAHYGVSWSAAIAGDGDRRAGVAAVLGGAAAAGAVHQAVAAAARRDGAARPRLDGDGGDGRRFAGAGRAHRLAGGVAQGRHRGVRRLRGAGGGPAPGRARVDRADRAAGELAVVSAAARGAAPVAAGQPDARDPARRRPRRLLHRRRAVAAGEPAQRVLAAGGGQCAGHVPARRAERRRPTGCARFSTTPRAARASIS